MSGSPKSFSLRSRLLFWLLGPLMIVGFIALWDTNNAAQDTADDISDRLLAGSVLAISEQVFVNENGELEVDVPYVALQMLTSSADDRVFYRIETLEGEFVTGYRQLNLQHEPEVETEGTIFFDSSFRGATIRIARFDGTASSNEKSLGFRVGVAETTNARADIAQSILFRSALRQSTLILAAVLLVWIAVTNALKPLSDLKRAIDRRNPEDMRPIKHRVPLEVEAVVDRINDLLARFSRSIEALRNFTSNTSHQLRTPLAVIHTHLELAQKAKTQAERATAIENANLAVANTERLMSQLLLLSRIDTLSRTELSKESCNLTEVARDVCEEFVLRLSHQKSSEVDLGFHGDKSVIVQADKTMIQEVVRNLVDNAIKHSSKTPKIDVSVGRRGTRGVVSVQDQGIGFDPAILTRSAIGKRGTADTSAQLSGGIGLSIVSEIVDLLNGRLTVRPADPGMIVSADFDIIIKS